MGYDVAFIEGPCGMVQMTGLSVASRQRAASEQQPDLKE